MTWQTTKTDLLDGTPLRRVAEPVKPKRRTQSDRMRELRTMRAEMRKQQERKP